MRPPGAGAAAMSPSHAHHSKAPPGPLPGVRPLLLVTTGVGLLMFLRAWLDELATGGDSDPWLKLLEELSGAYLAVLLLPLLVRMARRFPLGGGRLLRHLPLHLAGALGFAAAHTTLMWISRSLLVPLFGLGSYDYGHLPTRYLMELPLQLAIYSGSVLLVLAFDRYRRLRDAELEAATLRTQLSDAQLEALSRQIEPHFLFNTLNAISELMYRDVRGADEMIARLSELLRQAFSQRHAPFASLGDELRLLEMYLAIMRLRFGERLSLRIDVPGELLGLAVPRFVLQPLVENALQHGLDPDSQAADVTISASADEEHLVLRVRDHGPGPGQEGGYGIGLSNTDARIARLCGAGFGLTLREAQGGGAEVLLRLPRQQEAEVGA
jgi:signal transduction histidine kinase